MNSPDLPNLETAKGMVFDEITKAINAFIADAKINNASVCLEEIEALGNRGQCAFSFIFIKTN